MGGGDCAEVTLVTLEVILRGVLIGQDVAIELQRVDSFNYFNLPKIRFKLVKLIQFFLLHFSSITCFCSILAGLASLSGINFSTNSDTCCTAECFCNSVLLRFDTVPKDWKIILVLFGSVTFSDGSGSSDLRCNSFILGPFYFCHLNHLRGLFLHLFRPTK